MSACGEGLFRFVQLHDRDNFVTRCLKWKHEDPVAEDAHAGGRTALQGATIDATQCIDEHLREFAAAGSG
jgi:hypothetical protein